MTNLITPVRRRWHALAMGTLIAAILGSWGLALSAANSQPRAGAPD